MSYDLSLSHWYAEVGSAGTSRVDSYVKIGGKSGCKKGGTFTVLPTYPAPSSPNQLGTILLSARITVSGNGTPERTYIECDIGRGVTIPVYWSGEAYLSIGWRACEAPYGDTEVTYPLPAVNILASWVEACCNSVTPLVFTTPSLALGGGITSPVIAVPRLARTALIYSNASSTRTATDTITFYGRTSGNVIKLSESRFVSGGSANYTTGVPIPGGAQSATITNGSPAIPQNLGILWGLQA